MTFLAPWMLLVAAVATAAVVALHFLAWQRPPAAPLPTARFVPDRPARAASRSRRPHDVLLLVLRALLVLLVGAAFARPVVTAGRRPVARLVAVDGSRAVGNLAEARDSARALFRDGDALVLFDSTARLVRHAPLDSLAALGTTGAGAAAGAPGAPGVLSAAVVAALRAAPSLRQWADSVELVLVSPLAAEEVDAATDSLRALWAGRARVVRVSPASPTVPDAAPRVAVRARPDDPVLAAAALAGVRADEAPVRIVRDAVTAADSAWAAERGHALVRWPASDTVRGWAGRATADTAGALVIRGSEVVAGFARRWRPPAGRPIAWWVDGEVAAVERPLGAGCVRDVTVPAPVVGDEALTAAFQRFVVALAAPCGGARDAAPLPAGAVRRLAGPGPLYAPPAAVPAGATPLARWLFLAALALALLELPVREWGRTAGPARGRRDPPVRREVAA